MRETNIYKSFNQHNFNNSIDVPPGVKNAKNIRSGLKVGIIRNLKRLRGKCFKFATINDLEYIRVYQARCISVRCRESITSLLFRNRKYGGEQRIFVSNPRFLLIFLSKGLLGGSG